MGIFEKISCFAYEKKTLLFVGLDNSGKTSVINCLRPKKKRSQTTRPTVGFTVADFAYGRMKFTALDMSGQGKYRSMWEQYYDDTDGVVIVIDSSEKLRMAVVKAELQIMLCHPGLRRVPLLFFANKQDLPSSLPIEDIADMLGLNTLRDQPWELFPVIALTGEGIGNGLSWLSTALLQS